MRNAETGEGFPVDDFVRLRGMGPVLYASRMSHDELSGEKTRSVVSAILEDGAIVEMVYRREAQDTALLVHLDGENTEHKWLDAGSHGRIAPYSPRNNLLTHGVVLFPSGVGDYERTAELVAAVRNFIHRYADLSTIFEEVASYYVLLTWIYDAFSEVPYLRLKGDYGTGKSRCLLAIGSLCYKPMFVSGASTVSPIFRILDSFRGTLVMDESDFRFSDEKAEIVKILNNGNAEGFPVLRSEATPTKEFNPRAFTVFGPKIIATRRDFDDRALESRCITEVMRGLPPRLDIPLSLPDTFHDEARELRNKLLAYRFKNVGKRRDPPGTREHEIEARVAQVFSSLLAVVEDDDARKRILDLARKQSETIRADRGQSIEALLLGIILDMRREVCPLGVKEIAERFADRHQGDFARPITPRWIGAQIKRRLSLATVKSHGTFVIPQTEEDKLLALFERFDSGDDRVDVGILGTSSETISVDK